MMTINISNSQENIPKDSYTILIYGDFGSAKTPFAGTFPRSLYINCGAGISSLYSPKFESMYGKWSGIRADVIERDQFKPTAYDEIVELIEDYNVNHHDEFETIVIDDASAFQYFSMNKALIMASQMRNSTGAGMSEKLGANAPGLVDFMFEKSLVDQFMRNFADDCKMREKNFIVIAHAKRDYDKPAKQGDEAPLIKVYPQFTGQNKIPSYFDYVWYAQVEQGKASVLTEGNDLYEARSRYAGIFPTKYYNPNYKEIHDTLIEYYKNGKIPDIKSWKK